MKNRALARRYGIALYQVAKEKKEEQRIFGDRFHQGKCRF